MGHRTIIVRNPTKPKGGRKVAKKKTSKKKAPKKASKKKTSKAKGWAAVGSARAKAAGKRAKQARKARGKAMAGAGAARGKAAKQAAKAKEAGVTPKQLTALKKFKRTGKLSPTETSMLKRAGYINKDGTQSAKGKAVCRKVGIPGRKTKLDSAKTAVAKKATKKKATKKKATKKKATKKKATKKKATKKKTTAVARRRTAAARKAAATRKKTALKRKRLKSQAARRRAAGIPARKPLSVAEARKRVSRDARAVRRGTPGAGARMQATGAGWLYVNPTSGRKMSPEAAAKAVLMGKPIKTVKNPVKPLKGKAGKDKRFKGVARVVKPGTKRTRALAVKTHKRAGTKPTKKGKSSLSAVRRSFFAGTK